LSFKTEQRLSFEATSDGENEEYYCVEIKPGVKLLKTAIRYGANASGKTNLLVALDFLRNLVIESPKDKEEKIEVTPFLLDEESRKEKTSFFLSFFIDDTKFVYSVLLDKIRIYEEQLTYYPSVQPAKLYNRLYDEKTDSTKIEFGNHLKLGQKDQIVITGNTLNNCTVVASFAKSNVASSILNEVFQYFKKELKGILRPTMNFSGYTLRELVETPQMKSFILKILKQSDFNICNLEVKTKDIIISPGLLKAIQNTSLPDEVKKEYLDKGKIEQREIVYIHDTAGLGTYSLPEEVESRGTTRYVGMAILLYHLIKENRVIPIDEIEMSLHVELLSYFIKLFLANGDKHSQLIFTTHDINLLDEDFIHRDAVWFTTKNEAGESVLERLSNKRLHKNISPYNAYRQGKLGAKPFTGNISLD
jgi:AAA15 family ATPase/GTPase